MMHEEIMQVTNLTKNYLRRSGMKNKGPAVDNVNFSIKSGRFISIIGESGSGKTTIGRLILKLLKPSSGSIVYKGEDIRNYKRSRLKDYYRDVQGIFQDPYSTFNPLYKIDRVLKMVMQSFCKEETDVDGKIKKTIESVGMNPKEVLGKYPHQLSGGQLQRLLIVRALLLNVKILVADEIISMLDASTRIDILNLLGKLAYEQGMTVLFITHDLSLGYYISEETLIMRKGVIVELGNSVKLYKNPVHPYTQMLLKSVPDIGQKWDKSETFLPELMDQEIEAFYKKNQGQPKGMVEVEEDHLVYMTK